MGMHNLLTLSSKSTSFIALLPRFENAKLMERPAEISVFRKSGRIS
jgi:hypothetical protein